MFSTAVLRRSLWGEGVPPSGVNTGSLLSDASSDEYPSHSIGDVVFVATTDTLHVLALQTPAKPGPERFGATPTADVTPAASPSLRLTTLLRVSSPSTLGVQAIAVVDKYSTPTRKAATPPTHMHSAATVKEDGGVTLVASFVPRTSGVAATLSVTTVPWKDILGTIASKRSSLTLSRASSRISPISLHLQPVSSGSGLHPTPSPALLSPQPAHNLTPPARSPREDLGDDVPEWIPWQLDLPYTPVAICTYNNDHVVVSGTDSMLHAYACSPDGLVPAPLPHALQSVRTPCTVLTLKRREDISSHESSKAEDRWMLGCIDGTVILCNVPDLPAVFMVRSVVASGCILRGGIGIVVAEAAGYVQYRRVAKSRRLLEPPSPDFFAAGVSSVAVCPWRLRNTEDVLVGTLQGYVVRYDGDSDYQISEYVEVGDSVSALHIADVMGDGVYQVIATCQHGVAVIHFSPERVIVQKLLPLLQ